jgi:hypothetical protein
VAQSEALQGRHEGVRILLRAIEDRVDLYGVTDWSIQELRELAVSLGSYALLAQRLEALIITVEDDEPLPPKLPSTLTPTTVGKLWTGAVVGPAYSLLLRVPDILDRAGGVYLSDVIGEQRAAAINERLRRGRPDGGRVRITSTGTVISRRDGDSPWYVVGSVAADEWFPARTATTGRVQSLVL